MTATTNLGLPYIEASQAQKHVTHNETLRVLDALVMLSVIDRDLSAPPSSPEDGDRYLVKAPGSGAFAGKDDQVAHYCDGGWNFYAPRVGWMCFVQDESALLAWVGTDWEAVSGTPGGSELQNMTLLGVGTAADATNPFAAKLNNALWVAKTVTEGGDGTLRYKLSKEDAAKTLSLLFQDNYSGRAEIGLTGDDDFHFKVSPDGSTWYDGITIDRNTGRVSFPVSGGPREVLNANRTYYVRSDGSNANTGLADSSGGAFLTIQKALDVVATLDIGNFTVTIQVRSGTFAGATVSAPWIGGGAVELVGDTTTPSNCVLSSGLMANGAGSRLDVKGFQCVSSGAGVMATGGGRVAVTGVMQFGACSGFHFYATQKGIININSNYTINGNAPIHWGADFDGAIVCFGRTITLTGTPAFSSFFAYADGVAFLEVQSNTFSGSATGPRYYAQMNGVIQTFGGGATYLPGDSAGSTATGGQYA